MRSVSGLAMLVVCALSAGAADYVWNGGSGSFQTDSNWTPSDVPGSTDKAIFSAAGTYDVTFDEAVANAGATVGASVAVTDVTFDLNGQLWDLSGALSLSGTSTARFGGGALTVGSSVTVASGQKLVLNGGSTWFSGSQLGTASGGAIEVNGGTNILTWAMPLAPAPAGGVSLRLTGGTLALTNAAENSRFQLQSNGAKVSLEGGVLSVGSTIDLYGTRANPGVLDIHSNATLICTGWGVTFSRDNGGLGIVNVNGGLLAVSNAVMTVVSCSGATAVTTGLVNLVDGTIYVQRVNLAATTNGVGILRQTGGQLRATSDSSLGLWGRARGILSVEGGTALFSSRILVGQATNAIGMVNVSGGTLTVSGGLVLGSYFGSTGEVNVAGGALTSAGSVTIGSAAGSVGNVVISGGTNNFSNTMTVGSQGAGSLAVSGGTNLFLNTVTVGAQGAGSLTVSGGTNSFLNAVTVGSLLGGTGEVNVAGGTLVFGGNTVIGSASGSVGDVVISDGTNSFLNTVTVGSMGSGCLTFAGGLQIGTNASLSVADKLGSTGSLEISGGTNLFKNILFGNLGTATVKISGGYTWTTNRLVVGSNAGSTGRVELTGGVLAVSTIDGRDPTLPTSPGGISSILFDGGTLQHSWYLPDFKDRMLNGFGSATLTDRGLIVDTAGGIRTVDQVLSDEAGYAGSLTKRGEGKLTLSVYDNFTGRVSVEQGELTVSSGGAIYLCGGVAVDAGAILNLASAGALRQTVTTAGTVSRIDGALTLKSGVVLTNGVGATMGGNGVVTGSVAFATGSVYGRDRATDTGPLTVTGSAVFQSDVSVALTGYTAQQLDAGVPLVTADMLQMSSKLPVTLDGVSHPYWWAVVSASGKTLTARVIRTGTMISVQ